MREWDLTKAIVEASNNNDQDKLAQLIIDNDFTNFVQPVSVAISCFIITKDNVRKNIEAAKKLADFPEPNDFSIWIRQAMIIDTINMIEEETA